MEERVVFMLETKINQKMEFHIGRFFCKLVAILISALMMLFVLYGLKLGMLQDKTILVHYMKQFGLFAPLFFVFLQLFQVVFPVIPGGVSCLAGVLAFGPIWGFIYNYVGLVLGSCVAYLLSLKYGMVLINKIFKKETIQKYLKYIQCNQFQKIFFWGIFLPGLPDDLLCYIAGISGMSFKKFIVIILIGKPLSLILYSLFVNLF